MRAWWLLLFAGCASSVPAAPVAPTAATAPGAELELVETAPIETTLDHADVREAFVVWPEMIDRAKRTLDFGEFYASDAEDRHATRLKPTMEAIGRANARKVRVRFLCDASFASKYPATLDALRKAGAIVKTIDCAKRYGGIQHAKYMVIDEEDAFLGSQNFDWRSLEHVQEMGLRLHSAPIARGLADVFDTDWALADDATPAKQRMHTAGNQPNARTASGESIALYADPKGWLPDEGRWDLDRIVTLLDGAKTSIDAQTLAYSTQNRDKSTFATIDDALRRAAGRGVKVRLMVSAWGANAGSPARKSIEALAAIPNVAVHVITIPPWSGGDIPFARVAHAKYLVVDGKTAWVGTANWEGDYFLKTRNVAIVAEGGALAPRLDKIFDDGWSSSYAVPIKL